MSVVDEDIRRLIDRAIDPEFVGRLVADPEGVIRANGWTIAPDRLVAALRSAGVAPAEVEVLQSRISYSGLGRLVSSAIHVSNEGHTASSASSAHGGATSASSDQPASSDQAASTAPGASTDQIVSGASAPDAATASGAAPATADAPESDGDDAVPFSMDDGTTGMRAAPVDGVSGD